MIQLSIPNPNFFGNTKRKENKQNAGEGKPIMFCRFIAGMRAEVALLRFGLMAGAGIRLALCALIFALAAAVAEAQAQTAAPVDECAAGTDTCGASNLCGDTDDGFVCGQECPNGFVPGSNRTECAESCNAATHMIDADNYCVQSSPSSNSNFACAIAGWPLNNLRSTARQE